MAGQVWATNSLGGYMYSDNLSEELRMAVQPMVKFRQFCDVKDATSQGKKKGDTFHWDVYQDVSDRAASTLTETNTMPETNFTITQGTLTITEAGNSVPYSGKLDDLSKHPVKTIINKVLKNDATKWFDASAHAQFNATPLRVVPASGTSTTSLSLTTNGTATATNNVAFGKSHAKLVVDLMKERNIPAYTGDDYYALAWPSTYRTFKNDLESIHQYTDAGFQMIMNGEIGRYENVRYVEQTNIPKGGAANSTTWNAFTNTADAWDNGLSDWIFFFGEDTVAEAIAVPEEMRGKIPTDYGRSKGVAWYYLGGFGLVHPLDSATNSRNARVVKWDSAA
jgi:N4-gp56 family major capsid protein